MTDNFYGRHPSWPKVHGCSCGSCVIKCEIHDPKGPVNRDGPPSFDRPEPPMPPPEGMAHRNLSLVTYIGDNGSIHSSLDVFGHCVRSILDTQDKQVRENLIKLGWTPPPEPGHERFLLKYAERRPGGDSFLVNAHVDEMPGWVIDLLKVFPPRGGFVL